ncbi:deoxyribose-phosphate aldolase [Tumebacillus permanentifrigoris]|uniref:Deoxyribose-phosphate aldolase n=1 Tax=Tumebacillus permanentifrigoris TaxID=378543 RepID=A0A316D9I6_9BACL|nr:deoxyribose-phosphate aldolase [Tumebacillus permanentifrigoris]PWK08398.1 deoxyribose-phosphate aldolase [Tumebacillus permanentifrigoris]
MQEIIQSARTAVQAAIGFTHEPSGTYTSIALEQVASIIDHTLLKPEATPDQIDKLCAEAKQYQFASVCINPIYVARSAKNLAGTDVKVCTVIGFPLGANTAEVKAFEAKNAVANGAHEVDMVISNGLLRAGDLKAVYEEIKAVVDAVKGHALTKVIIETSLLTDEQKAIASLLTVAAGADFVKTSTGFSTGGATAADVALMRAIVGPNTGVKASGGIRSIADAQAVMEAGADRLGCSAGVSIVQGQTSTDSY